jgi:hypothetical protein
VRIRRGEEPGVQPAPVVEVPYEFIEPPRRTGTE